jgi:large subunit ribosomal protein L5
MVALPSLKEHYLKTVVPELIRRHGYSNLHEVPTIEKIVLNSGINAAADKATVEQLVKDMSMISGQKPLITRSKKSISNFKLRQGVPNGVKVTLRNRRMYEFFCRFVSIALPVIRDFRGVLKRLDGAGNINIGVQDYTIFPEIKIETTNRRSVGLDVAIVTTARTDREAVDLLELMGMAFKK